MLDTAPLLFPSGFPAISRARLEILQVNLGYKCNQTCLHCHVNAGPNRTEMMDRRTVEQVIEVLERRAIRTLDLTGGAPELNPHFRYLVSEARRLGVRVMDRCNLTVLLEPGQESLAEFLAVQRVEVVASLPCYLQENVDMQRGKGTYNTSISALQKLNSLGYGQGGELLLNLVYNPQGASLPPSQKGLEEDYKRRLKDDHGIAFDNLFTLANMPISRFGSMLVSKGEFHGYMDLLKGSYSDANLQTVMCRNLVSVDWQGYLYDCDFNQMLNLPLSIDGRPRNHLASLLEYDLEGRSIAVGDHCYGCTAGQGSSCGGALSE